MTETEYSAEQTKKLIGGKITNVFTSKDLESWGFAVIKGAKIYRAWVDCDPEGNGPGHIAIEEVKAAEDQSEGKN